MVLREKTNKSSGWRILSSRPGQHSLLTPSRRGGIYVGIIVFLLWLVLGSDTNTESSSSPGFGGKIRNQALRLTNSIKDEDIYGPEPAPHKQRPLHPSNSAIAPLRSWENGVPESTVHGISGGWSLLDNVILMNGTLFIIANDRTKLPPLDKMFSTGVPMESEPATWRGRGTTDREMQVVNQEAARTLFGNFGSRIQGTTFLCNDAPQFASHYYHFTAEILFGMWRTYSSLVLNIPASGHLGPGNALPAPRRFVFPHIPSENFKDYSGLNEYVSRAAFPSMAFEFSEAWADRNHSSRPFVFDRVVIGDRIAAELSPQWAGLYKYAAPAFEHPGSGTNFWGPVRRALVQFLGQDQLLSDSISTTSTQERKKTVITYVTRQDWGRRLLRTEDHEKLVKALKSLERRYGYEVNVVAMDKLSKRDQLMLATRTTVMMGVHGNGLTHALWMDPTRRPVLLEFFADKGFSFDYEYPMRQLGITYYGWWGNKYFSHRQLPQPMIDESFHSTDIRIDANAVAKLIREHVAGTLTDAS